MNPTEEFEIYQFLCKEAEAYVPLSQLLKDAHLTMEAASSAVADFRKQFQDGLQHWQISNQNPAAISLGLLQALQEHPGDSQLSFLYAAWITDRGLLFDWYPENRSEEQDIRVWLKQSKTVSEFQSFLQEQAVQKAQLPIFKRAAKKFQRNAEKGTDERDAIFYLSIQNPFFYAGRKHCLCREHWGIAAIAERKSAVTGSKALYYFCNFDPKTRHDDESGSLHSQFAGSVSISGLSY